jgi:lysozyme
VTARARWRHRIFVAGVGLLLVAIVLTIGWYEVMPRYRPPLQAGERYGIDVSNHQGAIDWRRVAGDNVSFAYIKATEGNDFVDKQFADNWAQSDQAGIPRGAYHFFTLCSSGATQAANFLKVVPTDPKALPPAVDLEFAGCTRRPDNATVQRELTTFISTVEDRIGKPVVVYVLPAFEKLYPVEQTLSRDKWQRKLFRRPSGSGWTLWQASDRARLDGIDAPVDLDVRRAAPSAAGRK